MKLIAVCTTVAGPDEARRIAGADNRAGAPMDRVRALCPCTRPAGA